MSSIFIFLPQKHILKCQFFLTKYSTCTAP
jgi:hypothetical protein